MFKDEVGVKKLKTVSDEDGNKLLERLRENHASHPMSSSSAGSGLPMMPPQPAPSTPLCPLPVPTIPMTPRDHVQPSRSPIPLPPHEPKEHLQDAEYVTTMQTLVASIHKSNQEWNKKSREFHIAAAKCKSHEYTKDSQLLTQMSQLVSKGDKLDKSLVDVEEKHAMGVFVDITEILQCKKIMSDLVNIAKEASKIKLFMRGHSIQLHERMLTTR